MRDYTIVDYERDLLRWETMEAYQRDCATDDLLAALTELLTVLEAEPVAELPI